MKALLVALAGVMLASAGQAVSGRIGAGLVGTGLIVLYATAVAVTWPVLRRLFR